MARPRRRFALAACLAGLCAAASLLAVAGDASWAQASGAAPVEPPAPGADPTLRLMSESAYLHTITNVFGPDIAANIRFAPVKRTDGLLAVGASAAVVTPGALDRLDAAARSVAQQTVDPGHRRFLAPCQPATETAPDDACARRFLGEVGRLLYRRPLTERELALKVDIAAQATAKEGDFYAGLGAALTGMLVSPNFLLIREKVEPDPSAAGRVRLDSYSKAARLSFLLWDAAPDDLLLRAAARGELQDPAGLQRQTERMIASPQFQDGVRAFFEDFLVLEAFDNVAKDSIIYPAFTSTMAGEAREQMLRTVVDHLVTRKGDYRDLFTTRRTMMSAPLASIYRAPMDLGPSEWKAYEFPVDDPRVGILTQVAFLAQYGHPGRSSPTRRGRGIREVLLCQKVPDPPPNVDFSIVEDPHAKFHTARERLFAHATDPTCRGCHALTDPLGLALEKFDGAGQFRETEQGAPIDASGELNGVKYADAAGLARTIRDDPALRACIVNRLFEYGTGRSVTRDETPLLRFFQARLDRSGYRLDGMLRLIVFSNAFFAVRQPTLAQSIGATALLTEKASSHAH